MNYRVETPAETQSRLEDWFGIHKYEGRSDGLLVCVQCEQTERNPIHSRPSIDEVKAQNPQEPWRFNTTRKES